METITTIHAKAEHFIYLLAGLAVLLPLVDTVRKRALSSASVWTVRVYTIGATLQLLLGLTQLALRWSEFGDGLRYRLEHAALMLVAVGLVHMAPRFMKRNDAIGARNTTYLMIASIALIVLGTTLIKTALRG
jgi:hypothetical protein